MIIRITLGHLNKIHHSTFDYLNDIVSNLFFTQKANEMTSFWLVMVSLVMSNVAG